MIPDFTEVGDFVQQDEEVATIETDKIDVTVNASDSGKITELLAKEEDTVTVGQDLLKLDSSASGESGAETSTRKEESSEESKIDQSKEGRANTSSAEPKNREDQDQDGASSAQQRKGDAKVPQELQKPTNVSDIPANTKGQSNLEAEERHQGSHDEDAKADSMSSNAATNENRGERRVPTIDFLTNLR